MAADSGASGGLTEYIQHHLTHNRIGGVTDGVHLDSWLTALGLGLLFCFWFWSMARKATPGVPGKGQAFVEMIIEFVDGQVKDVFHGSRVFIAPFALTIFMWVFFMNAMDLLPLDLIGLGVQVIAGEEAAHHTYWRVVPTADLNTTLAMSTVVFIMTIFYSIKAKGGWGFTKELFTAPFHADGAGLERRRRHARSDDGVKRVVGVAIDRAVKAQPVAGEFDAALDLLDAVDIGPSLADVVEMREQEALRIAREDAEPVADVEIAGEGVGPFAAVEFGRQVGRAVRKAGAGVEHIVEIEPFVADAEIEAEAVEHLP